MNANHELLNRSLDAWNRHDLDTYRQLYHPDAVIYGLAPVPLDIPAALDGYKAFFAGFPDLKLEVVDTIIEDENIAVRIVVQGTHLNTFQGIPATGKKINVSAITTLHFRDGRVYERWNQLDQMSMMQQLGVIPTPG